MRIGDIFGNLKLKNTRCAGFPGRLKNWDANYWARWWVVWRELRTLQIGQFGSPVRDQEDEIGPWEKLFMAQRGGGGTGQMSGI